MSGNPADHHRVIPQYVLGMLALLVVSCSSAGAPSPPTLVDAEIRTDQLSYSAVLLAEGFEHVEMIIPFTIENTGTAPVVSDRMQPSPGSVFGAASRRRLASSAVEQGCLSPPFVIASGMSPHDTLHVVGALPGQRIAPTFMVPVAGEYRLNVELYSSLTDAREPLGKDLLPDDLRHSNVFSVTE